MTRFPRPDYRKLRLYSPDRSPVEIDLSDNTNLWGSHPAAAQALQQADPVELLRRYPTVYGEDLKEAIARRFDVSVECLTTAGGSSGLIIGAFTAAQEGSGRFSFLDPTFALVSIVCRMQSHRTAPVPWEEGARDPTLLLREEPSLVYVPRPNNPTGHQLPRSWLRELQDAIGDDGPLLVVDEAYAEFADETILHEAVGSPRTVVFRTLSKAYGLAGLRIGFAVGSPVVVAELEKARAPYVLSRSAELAAVAALDSDSSWVTDVVAEAVASRDRLIEELRSRGASPPDSGANFVFVPLPADGVDAVVAGLRSLGILVRPFHGPRNWAGIRVTVGPWAIMTRFLDAFDAVVPGLVEATR